MKTLRNIILGLTLASAATIGFAAEKEEVDPVTEFANARPNRTELVELLAPVPLYEARDGFGTYATTFDMLFELPGGKKYPATALLAVQSSIPKGDFTHGDVCQIEINLNLPNEKDNVFRMMDFGCNGLDYQADTFYDYKENLQVGHIASDEMFALVYAREKEVLRELKEAMEDIKLVERQAMREEICALMSDSGMNSRTKAQMKTKEFTIPFEDKNGDIKPMEARFGCYDYSPYGVFDNNDKISGSVLMDGSQMLMFDTRYGSHLFESGDSYGDIALMKMVNSDSSLEDKYSAFEREYVVLERVLDALR